MVSVLRSYVEHASLQAVGCALHGDVALGGCIDDDLGGSVDREQEIGIVGICQTVGNDDGLACVCDGYGLVSEDYRGRDRRIGADRDRSLSAFGNGGDCFLDCIEALCGSARGKGYRCL